MTKRYDVCGLGNALVDILVEVTEQEFQQFDVPRGSMRLVDVGTQGGYLNRINKHKARLCSGGSVANSVIVLAQLGGRAALTCCVGDDSYGLHYFNECEQLGVELPVTPLVKETTGTCLVLVTPDAERTMCTALGVSSLISPQHIDEKTIAASEWLFIEGYLFANPEYGQQAVAHAVDLARKHKTRIAITCSEAWVVQNFGEPLKAALAQADMVFANEHEAVALTGAPSVEAAFRALCEKLPAVAVTAGAQGAYVRYHGVEAKISAVPCQPVDLTGAGDAFAGGLLHGMTHGLTPAAAGAGACALAGQVIQQIGARLQGSVSEVWQAAAR